MREVPTSPAALRQWLAARSPAPPRERRSCLPSGVPALDAALGGGLPGGALTELVSAAPSSGGTLVQSALLRTARARWLRTALVDGSNAFDPQSYEPGVLQALIWVRCRRVPDALAAADLLVRDGNLGLVLLDLRGGDAAGLLRVSPTNWYRLQRAVETTGIPLVVQTDRPTVPSASHRIVLERSLALDDTDGASRAALLGRLPATLQRRRWEAGAAAAV